MDGNINRVAGDVRYFPLNSSQRGIYFECMGNPELIAYNLPFALYLPDGVEEERFLQAVRKAVVLHPVFFVTIGLAGGEPAMCLKQPAAGEDSVEIARSSAASAEEAFDRFIRPFDLEKGPLYRFELCRIGDRRIFLWDVHHIICDGTSVKLFFSQIADLYAGKAVEGEQFTLFEAAEQEINAESTSEYKAAEAFYDKLLEDVETDTAVLPDIDRNSGRKGQALLKKRAPEDLNGGQINEFADRYGVTRGTVFLAAFSYTLSLFAGTKNCCFTTACSGRHDKRLAATVGMFVKTLPVCFKMDSAEEIGVYLKKVQNTLREAVKQDCIPFGEFVKNKGINADISFVYQSDMFAPLRTPDGTVPLEYLNQRECFAKIFCMAKKFEDGYELELRYDTGLYSQGLMESFADTVFAVIGSMLSCRHLGEIEPVGDSRRLYADINNTDRPYDLNTTVNSMLEDALGKYADKTALVYRDRVYSFAEFDRITGNIAAFLAGKNIGAEDYVAVLAPREDMTVLAAWGVIRAGAAFQPLDPTYPEERLNYMIKDTGAGLLIADRSLRPLVGDYRGEVLYTDEIPELPEAELPVVGIRPENALTIIYTSGTTGTPKGCVLENRNLTAFCMKHIDMMGLEETSRVASYASFGFDAGVMDIVSAPLAGAALYIVPDEIRLDLAKVEEFYIENGITHGFMTTQVGRMFAEQTKCSTLRAFLVGGEKLVPFKPQESFRFINGYGPCETMAYICHYDVQDNSSVQPVGKPGRNTKLYVADAGLRLLPAGGVGELCIAGRQVGRGYLGLPEKTAEVFVPNPFDEAPGYERIYRTGDVVRMLPDGNIEYIGRNDGQVKIRGFRVELTEVEEIIRRFPEIKDAAVAAFEDQQGGKYLAAYVAGEVQIDTGALAEFICSEKPPYMVPAVIMQLPEIPYTQNQKVDRRALPKPERRLSDEELEKPSNGEEKKLFDLAAEVLGHESFGVNTDLFEAGMTSISTLKFNLAIGNAFEKPVKMADIKAHSTVRKLARFLAEQDAAAVYEIREDYPLMQNQRGIFVESEAGGSNVKYNIPVLFRLSGGIDEERLQKAVCEGINAHSYIKATLRNNENGEVTLHRNDGREPEVEILRMEKLPAASELAVPFNMLGEKLYRARIYVTGEGKYLFLDVHHILADGTSLAILLEDINKAYLGEPPETEKFTGFEQALEEEKTVASDKYAEAEKYYEKLLQGCNTECLPGRCPEEKENGRSKALRFSFEASEKIADYCKKQGITANAFFNAVFGYTLAAFLHTDDVTWCTVYNGRNDSRLAGSFAMLVKTLPVRCAVECEGTVEKCVRSMQNQLLDSMSEDVVSFADLAHKYGLNADIFFNYQGDNFNFDSIGGEPAEMIPVDTAAKAPLSIEVFLKEGVFTALLNYRTDYFCGEFAASLAGSLKVAAEGFTEMERLAEVSLISAEERQNYAVLNATEQPFEAVPAHAFFERMAEAEPDRIAVRTRKMELTYGELRERAACLAEKLVSLGVKPDEIIGVILDRSELVPVAELGILMAGGAFLNMLPTYPGDRIEFCMRDAECRYVLTTQDIMDTHGEFFDQDKPYQAVCIDEPGGRGSWFTFDCAPASLAYCIYTSGSTGTPKGVMLEHHNLSNFVQTAGLCSLLEKGTNLLCMASISFDMSITEMLFPLCHGKTIYIATEEEIHNPDLLLEAFTKNGIDLMMMTPSFAWSLLSMPGFGSALAQLKGIVLGAEAFQPQLYTRLKELNPDMMIINGYGPTECTQVCSAKVLTGGEHITIGKPFANTKFYVVDDRGRLLPRYAVGELIICGEGVCRGYVKLPERNAEAFTEIDGVRGYHSGDLVRINRDNEIEFGGRADNQVKLRGFRIELDEIENVMQEYEGIIQSRVIVRNNGTEDYLAGYYTASSQINPDDLTAFLKTKLTYYMVPAAMLQLEKMPVTQNGKLDKKALPDIKYVRKAKKGKTPKKSLEEKLTDLFKANLNADECFADDNFFEIGGTSLSASKVVMQLKAEGYRIEYQDIFDHQTAEELAEYLENQGKTGDRGQEGTDDNVRKTGPTGNVSKVTADKTVPAEEGLSGVKEIPGELAELLKYNSLEYAGEAVRSPLGDVLLTGATGFLGSHILKALLEMEEGRIICILRKGDHEDIRTRLQATLVYYFENDFNEAFKDRIRLIEGDITDDGLRDKFRDISFDTLINCAACVKHYASDNSIEFVNVHGVEKLIELAVEKKARMIQISTTSVPGAHTPETYRQGLRMKENRLFVVDDMNNQYCRSKYQAEVLMLQAIQKGMKGKIIRVGNLMGRYSDGEFQTNMRTNSFLNGLRGFVNIGKWPVSHSTDPVSFSPVDCTSTAVVLLAGTDDRFTVFNAESRSTFDEMMVFETINRYGIEVKPVSDEEYYSDFRRLMADNKMNGKISALLTNDRPDMHMVEADNRFTANVLYRLGFSWPFIDDEYLGKVIESLDTLDFFFMDV